MMETVLPHRRPPPSNSRTWKSPSEVSSKRRQEPRKDSRKFVSILIFLKPVGGVVIIVISFDEINDLPRIC